MSHLRDLSGQRFGRLLVLERVPRPESIKTKTYWLCKCDCGVEKPVVSSSLLRGNTVSCGCRRSEVFENNKIGEGLSSFNRLFRQYKQHARQRDIVFSLSREDFQSLTKKECFYCGKPPSQIVRSESKTGDYIYSGIDRIDSSKGYVAGNVVSCCKQCNRCKSDMTVGDFYIWISTVYERIHR